MLDVGCGTGVLAVDLATAGHRVTGVDPAAAMLAVARTKAGGEMVTWLAGDASVAPTGGFDLALMTGHVAQVFTDEFSWRTTLTEGFEVESLHGDWDRSPVLLGVGPASPEQIYVARRT